MPHDPAAVARRWFEEVWNQRRGETIDELLSAEGLCHADHGPIRGPGEFREQMHVPFLSAFPDIRVTLEGVMADGDEVAVRWSAAGTHAGDGLGFPATGRPVALRGLTWLRVRDGKFVEGWQSSNIPEVFRSLAPPPDGLS
jgi:steroid delta-isomerase-like uncharacterized protein